MSARRSRSPRTFFILSFSSETHTLELLAPSKPEEGHSLLSFVVLSSLG